MEHQQSTFSNRHDMQIFQQCWTPQLAAKGCVALVHGLGEHSGRYQSLGAYLSAAGYSLCALDLPGHGHSEGRPGHAKRFSDYLDTVEDFLERLRASYPATPIYLLGHSMGGLISASLLLSPRPGIAGAILSGAAIQSPLQPAAVQMLLIRLLSLLAPQLGVLQLDASGISRDPEVVRRYSEDPLVYHGKISARSVAQLFAAMETVQRRAGDITLPLLILHGEADSMAAAEGSKLLYQRAASSDKELHIYPGLYHEIFNEPEQSQIFAELLAWLEARCAAA